MRFTELRVELEAPEKILNKMSQSYLVWCTVDGLELDGQGGVDIISRGAHHG